MEWLRHEQILSFEEIERLARLLVKLGITQIRLTGGEPLVRKDLPRLVAMLSRIEGLRSLSLTTNGVLLKEQAKALAEAGLHRINVSLDSLVREKFHRLTHRDALHRVLEGLAELEKYPAITPVKINVVAMRDFSEEEVLNFALFARQKGYSVRFIEFMPLDADQQWDKSKVLTGNEIKTMVERKIGPLICVPGTDPSETARRYRFADGDGKGELGFINPVSQPFCSSCDRIRLTAEGMLRTCLFAHTETDLKAVLRSGADDNVLEETIREAVFKKEMKHYINDSEAFRPTSRKMSQIGG